MGRKKKIQDEPEEESSILEDDWQDDEEEDNNNDSSNYDFSDSNTADNALQYASIVSTPSETAGNFKHMPKETRYSFLDGMEVRDIKHWDKTYRNYQYMKKVFKLQAEEDINMLKNRLTLYEINTYEELEEYCRSNNNLMVFNRIKSNPEIIKELLEHISTLQESGFYEDLQNQNEMITGIYDDYRQDNEVSKYIDDLGMTGNIFGTSLTSMGREGNERNSQITVINATKDIDMKKEQELKSEYKNKIGSFVNKFR